MASTKHWKAASTPGSYQVRCPQTCACCFLRDGSLAITIPRWLKRLGWDRAAKVDAFELEPLDATRIADVLVKLGAPVDVLTHERGLVERCWRAQVLRANRFLSVLAEDLWIVSRKGARIGRADLELLKPGFDSYFKRWFELQDKLWKEEGGGVDRRELDAILSVLAFALGPLGEADLLTLMERLLGPWRSGCSRPTT